MENLLLLYVLQNHSKIKYDIYKHLYQQLFDQDVHSQHLFNLPCLKSRIKAFTMICISVTRLHYHAT